VTERGLDRFLPFALEFVIVFAGVGKISLQIQGSSLVCVYSLTLTTGTSGAIGAADVIYTSI
jgi:hypothetical protein